MEGVSWRASRSQESFSRSSAGSNTLTRLADFIARADPKHHTQTRQQPLPKLPLHFCQECSEGFPQLAELLQHQELSHALPKPHRCPSCGQQFSLRSSLQLHNCRQSHLYACAPCGRSFSQKQALLHHQQAGCNELQRPSEDDFAGPSEEANGDDERSVVVRKHQNKKTKSRPRFLSCRSCDGVFSSNSTLHVHRKEKHSREKHTRREVRPAGRKNKRYTYPCPTCCKVFFHHLSLRAHHKQHAAAPKEPKAADNGSANTQPPQRLPKALAESEDPGGGAKTKEVEEEFPCPSCAEVFSLQQQLKKHQELHQSSLRSCSVCTNHMDDCKAPGSKRPKRLYHCVPCQQGFSALDGFLEHCQEHLRLRVEEDRMSEASRSSKPKTPPV